ncbi:MAG: AAA family ATPase [Thermodesulfobacteriota bacterium]|nr:AAA family ATPase [Thermodesulfobacteriota bacterium]
MKEKNQKIPNPNELEKEISEFLTKRFGGNVKIVSPIVVPQAVTTDKKGKTPKKKKRLDFNLKPEDLISYLDQYIVKQHKAKAILSTKICTHFHRIKHAKDSLEKVNEIVGGIKNNVLMIGPTGVGKTYMIKLIAKKIGVPFIKGDATKFSETGYVGGDVEDLVRDLVRETNDDIELAQYGIVYIDELDKIASSRNLTGADVSRTGVQRALLKPMEETDIDLKVPHDPISMLQEIERYRKTGKRDKRTINTKSTLFIMSGGFNDLDKIIKKRVAEQGIGFGAHITSPREQTEILQQVTPEDLIKYGFESEFVGRLPVKTVFEKLTEEDLYEILKNPNNPIILGKKLDFAAYGIEVKLEDKALHILAKRAFDENTGARGLVSVFEIALLLFEKKLPSTNIKKFPVTAFVIEQPEKALETILSPLNEEKLIASFNELSGKEKESVKEYVQTNRQRLSKRYNLTMTQSRIDIIASFYCKHIMDIGHVIEKIKTFYDEIKKIELFFFQNNDINIVMEEDAVDFIIKQFIASGVKLEEFYQQLIIDFEPGFKLIREKTGKNRFFITKQALLGPESFISNLIKDELKNNNSPGKA